MHLLRTLLSGLLLCFCTAPFGWCQLDFDIPGRLVVEAGLSRFQEPSEPINLRTWDSRAFNAIYVYDIHLGTELLSLMPGVGIGVENYTFEQPLTLLRTPTSVAMHPLPAEWDVQKSKLSLAYLDAPLELRFRTSPGRRAFRMAVGGKVGMLVNSHTKVRYEDDQADRRVLKDRGDFHITRFRYGLSARVGFSLVNLFAYYALNDLFEPDRYQAQTQPRSLVFGITFTGF